MIYILAEAMGWPDAAAAVGISLAVALGLWALMKYG